MSEQLMENPQEKRKRMMKRFQKIQEDFEELRTNLKKIQPEVILTDEMIHTLLTQTPEL
jgi:predicted nuclease with TOPRIM domain